MFRSEPGTSPFPTTVDPIDPFDRVIAAEGRFGMYESHYLKANAPDGSAALWLKHGLIVPTLDARFPAAAQFWVVLWQAREGVKPRVWYQPVALHDVALDPRRLGIAWGGDSGEVRLDPARASGNLGGDPGVSWHIDMVDELPPLRHFTSAWMYSPGLPTTKLHTPSPRVRLRGTLTAGEAKLDLARWVGHRGHNWGRRPTHRYVYGSCNIWEGGADLTVDAFSAQGRLGEIPTPWATVVRGLQGGASFGRGSLYAAMHGAAWVEWPAWTAWGAGRGRKRVRLEMRLDPAHAVGLRYLHPDGGISYCYGVKNATVDLMVGRERAHSRAGELEFLFPEPLEGIALHGSDSLGALNEEAARDVT